MKARIKEDQEAAPEPEMFPPPPPEAPKHKKAKKAKTEKVPTEEKIEERMDPDRTAQTENRDKIRERIAKRQAAYDPALVLKTVKVPGAVGPAADVPPVWHPKPTITKNKGSKGRETQPKDAALRPTAPPTQTMASSSSSSGPTLKMLAAQAHALQ